jgi:dihydrolipoamide dehydrogenase
MNYDVIFLGGGPAGYEGAVAAAKLGLKTAVVEKEKAGGTCLHWGCIPTKALLHPLKTLKAFKDLAKAGLTVKEYELDVDKLKKYKERVVSKLCKGIELLFKQHGVDLVSGQGRLTAPNRVSVDGVGELTAKHIVLCTGSVPADLPFLKADGERVINSDHALELSTVPPRMLIVGAGAIGLEMAVIYTYLGSSVTVVEVLDHVVPGSDAELADILKGELKKQKISVLTSTTLSNPVLDEMGGGVAVTLSQEGKTWEERFDRVMLAVGRKPRSQGIAEESLGLSIDRRGFVVVDDQLQTNLPGVFACGDLVGQPLLAHKASHQAMAIAEKIAKGTTIRQHPVPGAVFTFPEFASIGLTEEQAKAELGEVKVGRFAYAAGSRSNAIDEKSGMVKVVARADGTLVGAHIVGAEAGELMPILNWAVTQGLKAEAFKDFITIHPTLSENVWEAVAQIGGFSIHG